MLTKITVVDKTEVLENGCVQVRTATRIMEDGQVLSQSFHRHVVAPAMTMHRRIPRCRRSALRFTRLRLLPRIRLRRHLRSRLWLIQRSNP